MNKMVKNERRLIVRIVHHEINKLVDYRKRKTSRDAKLLALVDGERIPRLQRCLGCGRRRDLVSKKLVTSTIHMLY